MGAVIDRFLAAGVRVDLAGADQIRAFGDLTDDIRRELRQHKPVILAELTQLAELRELVVWLRQAEPERWTDADEAEAIEVGSHDIEAALTAFRDLKEQKRDFAWAGFVLNVEGAA